MDKQDKQIGSIIEQGPQNWSIIQQEDGRGVIELSGLWVVSDGDCVSKAKVYVRVIREDDGCIVVAWKQCQMLNQNKWRIRLESIPTGGLYRIETCLQVNDNPLEWVTRGDMIHHIGVGDLWVIAGQSNAAGYGRGPLYDPPELGVHVLRHSGNWDLASHPFNDSTNSIHLKTREGTNPGHSPFLVFGKRLRKETGAPIGLIPTALGGSALSVWNPDEDGTLYQHMMDVIHSVGSKVKGIVWYQGCTDCTIDRSSTYLDRFSNFVNYVRRDLGDAELPILTVQLNRDTVTVTDEIDRSWSLVREAQRQAALRIPKVCVVPALDCPLSDHIHNSPAGNMILGERLAMSALSIIYAKREPFRAPEIHRAVLSNTGESIEIHIEFKHVQGYLVDIGSFKHLFTVIDDFGTIDIEDGRISSNSEVDLVLARKPQGNVHLHSFYGANPTQNCILLDTGTYMPVLAFYSHEVT